MLESLRATFGGCFAVMVILMSDGCSSRAPDGCSQEIAATQASPIYGGEPNPTFLMLSPDETAGVAFVRFTSPTTHIECSGIVVNASWVLTAAHCAGPEGDDGGVRSDAGGGTSSSMTVTVGQSGGRSTELAVDAVLLHPALDVTLLHVTGSLPVAALQLFGGDVSRFVGSTAQIAGFGLTNDGGIGALNFAVERIAGIAPTTLTGDSVSGSGACEGDSGGPMMVRDDAGQPVVIGLESVGSAGCNQLDEYIRIDFLRDWVIQNVGPLPAGGDGCGALTSVGGCFFGSAVWCDARGVRAAVSCGAPDTCGWSASEAGFRCVTDDPCQGVGPRGTCVAVDQVARCSEGSVNLIRCSCGSACEISGSDDLARCVQSQ